MHDRSAKFNIGLAFTAPRLYELEASITCRPADTMLTRRNRAFRAGHGPHAGIGEVGEPFELGRNVGEVAELGRGQGALERRRASVSDSTNQVLFHDPPQAGF